MEVQLSQDDLIYMIGQKQIEIDLLKKQNKLLTDKLSKLNTEKEVKENNG